MVSITPFDPITLLLVALLNPAVVIVAVLMGRRASEWQKLPVAAFAASLAGMALFWLGGELGFFAIHALGGEAAILGFQTVLGLIWASLAYRFWPLRA
jgi:hypothetical protein